MPWAKIDDDAPSHPKMFKAGLAAFGLWVAGNCYCNKRLTDGFISTASLGLLFPGSRPTSLRVLAERLVSAGLWERCSDGWKVHDFHQYNPTAEQVKADRKAAQDRKNRWRERRSERGRNAVPGGEGTPEEQRSGRSGNAVRNDAHARALPDPTRPLTPLPPTRSGTGTRWSADMFNRDCPDEGWRGECVSASWIASHPGEDYPRRNARGEPKQCEQHRVDSRGA